MYVCTTAETLGADTACTEGVIAEIADMKRMKSATAPFWMPELVAPPEGQPAATVDSGAATAASAAEDGWPATVDVRYFESELRMASEFLDIVRSCPEYAEECVSRALRCYVLLSGWVQSNGGNASLEEQLQRLRWRIAALQDRDQP